MKKILIGSGDQNYAPSIASATAETGLTPDILAAGAVAVYGLVNTDSLTSGNNNQSCLVIKAAGTGGAGKIETDRFLAGGGELIQLVQGAATFQPKIDYIQVKNIKRLWKQAYVAAVKEVSFIGYNGTSGSLNLPTIVANSDATVLAVEQELSAVDQIRNQEDYPTAPLAASAAAYDIIIQIVNAFNTASYKTHTAFVTANGTVADFTGTATALLFTKGSTTVSFMIQDATSGFVASTGTVAAADLIFTAHQNMKSVTFTCTANATKVCIGGTIYVVADAGADTANATAVAAAINAGGLATATVNSAAVTVTLKPAYYGAKILAFDDNGAGTYATLTLTVNTTTGETVGTVLKALAAVSAAASFELDKPYMGETGYFLGGTSLLLNTGIMTTMTEYGIKMVVDTAGKVYNYAKQGVLESSTLTIFNGGTITNAVAPSKGLGTGVQIVKIEEGLIAYRGQFDSVDRRMKQLPRFASESVTYDVYTIQYSNSTVVTGFDHNRSDNSTIQIAIPVGTDGQSDFEAVLKELATEAAVNF